MNLFKSITYLTLLFISSSVVSQNLNTLPAAIQENLTVSGQVPTIKEINEAYLLIPDSLNGDVNKDYIKAQRWMRYVLSKYNIEDSNSYSLSDYSQTLKEIHQSLLYCSGSDSSNWTSEGPSNIPGQNGGWTNSVYGDPDDTTRMLIGTNTSGIFITEDEGSTWQCVTDEMDYPVLGVNQIVSSPDDENYLLATTGTIFIDGGLIYSEDRGDTWYPFILETPFFNWIDYHPSRDGCLFGVTDEGVLFSNDYGESWTDQGLPSSFPSIAMNNYKVICTEDKILIATSAKYSARTELYEADISIDNSGNLSLVWNNSRLNENFKTLDDQIYFIDFSNEVGSKFYLQILKKDTTNSQNPFNEIHVTYDSGSNFNHLTQANIVGNLAYFNSNYGRYLKNELVASENDTSIVYWGCVSLLRKANVYNGTTSKINGSSDNNGHYSDYRSSCYLNNNGRDRIIYGNDGGVGLIRDGASVSNDSIESINGDLSINLIHAFHIHEPTGRILYAFQDHAMRYKDKNDDYSGEFMWEGSSAMIQDKYVDGIVGEDAYEYLCDIGDHPINYTSINSSPNPIVQPNFADNRLSLGAYFVKYRHERGRFARGVRKSGGVAMNRGVNISEVSEIDSSSSIGAVAICQRIPDYIYAAEFAIRNNQGDSRFKFYRSTDDGATWDTLTQSTVTIDGTQRLLSDELVWNGIRAIAVDHTDSSVVYCGIGGTHTYNNNTVDERFRVIKSTDSGDNFIDFSDGLPALPVERLLTVESDENLIFCANSAGIYYRMDGMSQWECFNENLPMVEITGMQFDYCANELWVSTYGRGMWKTPVPFNITSGYQREVTGTETWNDYEILKEDLVIKDGAVLTITDTVQVAYDKKIIVEQGGRLNIDGGVITNYCNKFWKGIEVWGNHDENQSVSNQGVLVLKNNAVIENAKIAINMWEHGSWTKTGGVLYAYNSTFRNNWKSIEYMPYHDFNQNGDETSNKGLISNCEFVWTDDYEVLGGTNINPAITLFGVNGVQIRGCDFIDNRTYQHNYGEHAIGVLSFDATYRVIGRRLDLNNVNDPAYTHETYDTTDFDISTFKNLYKGIFAMNANSQSSVIIDHCKFEDSRIGIDVRAVNNMQITRNRFEFSTSHSSNITKMNHVIMEESSAFTIEGNQFYNDDLNSTTDGVVITNSGIENNNVFKNEFDDVYAANLAFGNNTNDELSFNPPRGLEWLCNNYNSIKYDQISVLYNPTFGDLKGVKLSQGNASSGAGNSFSNGLDAGSNEYHFSSEDPDEIVYFMYDNNSSSPSEINGNIMLLDDDIENACQSSFGGTILGVSGVTMLKESTKSTMLNNLDSYESYINQWTDTLDIRVENANTSQFYEDVQNLDTTSWGELYDELREASPYLKEDLLKLLGQQYSPHFPHNWYKTIITDNIEIARSNEFMRFLKTKRVPLPDAEYNEIDSLRFITTTERGDILSNLDRYDSRSTLYNNLLLTNEYSDTLETKWGTLDSLVEVRTDDLLGQQRTDLYLGVNDVTTAKNILNSIQPTSSEYKYVEDQLQDFIDFKNYLLDDELINTYGFIETLSSQDSADIVDYMNNSIGLPKKQAENILCFYSGDCDDFTYQYSYQGKSIDYDQEIYDDNEIQQVEIKVIPNPNEGAFSIVTNEREINGVFVTNSHGQRIELSEIVIDNNQAFISLRNSITGIYYIQVRFKSGLIETVKFAIF